MVSFVTLFHSYTSSAEHLPVLSSVQYNGATSQKSDTNVFTKLWKWSVEFLSTLEELEIYLVPLCPLLCSAGVKDPKNVNEACAGIITTWTGSMTPKYLTSGVLLFWENENWKYRIYRFPIKKLFEFFHCSGWPAARGLPAGLYDKNSKWSYDSCYCVVTVMLPSCEFQSQVCYLPFKPNCDQTVSTRNNQNIYKDS